MEQNQTLGEFRVRTKFNVNNDSLVDQIKQKSAELIDLINNHNSTLVGEFATEKDINRQNNEFFRLKALAMTSFEEGAMWAVKMVTV